MSEPIHIISLGAGVQSSTMALMAAQGEITPMPVAAIFADTQAEPQSVYRWLDWLEKQLPFPVHRVTAGNLTDTIGAKRPIGKFRRVDIPAFIFEEGEATGFLRRSCTRDFKIRPIQKKVREIAGLSGKRSPKVPVVVQWIGISRDEAHRMKPSREAWITNRWPLVDAGIRREDCIRWMLKRGFDRPPKSSCLYCPYHGDKQWLELPPAEFEEACKADDALRTHPAEEYRTKGTLFIHRTGKPLREVEFAKDDDGGQGDLFGNECEGMCGV